MRDEDKLKRAEAVLKQRTEQLRTVQALGIKMVAELDMNLLLDSIVASAVALVQGDSGVVGLYDPEREVLEVVTTSVTHIPPAKKTLRPGEGVSGIILQTGRPLIVNNYPRWSSAVRSPGREIPAAVIGVPIQWHDKFLGVLNVASKQAGQFTEADAELLLLLAAQAAVALQNARLHEEVRQHSSKLEDVVAERTRELRAANARLRELDQLKSKFLDSVSHELRTPLTNLRLYLDLMKRAGPENHSRYLDIFEDQMQRLTELTEGILQITQIDLGEQSVKFTAVALEALVEQLLERVREKARRAGVTLSFTAETSQTAVQGNKSQLAQAILNLLTNAINYNAPGGTVAITISPSSAAGYLQLTIADTGIGIPADELPYVFDRFYRGSNFGQSEIPGFGLGLSIAAELIKLHGGRLEIESQAGQGSTVTVFLPVA